MSKILVTLFCFLLAPSALFAHHSSAMFDKDEVREVTATIAEFQWTNPHVWIEILVKNEEGMEAAWSIEGLGPNGLARNGWRPNSFKPGDVVEIRFNPMRDGSNAGGFIGAKFADGKILGNWN
ncbi:MAG: DUF6152 family protein [Proteobacteria bacterium]|nr:DUF6152 family protein [Pseudomonadota bacterium]MDA0992573.1 DUF6152 family protein [Pseudomonadota bacterium]